MLRLRLCGGVEVERDGRLLPDALLGGRQGRLALAYLTVERHRPVSRDELADLLWGDQLPDSWSSSLSAVVSRLRRLLGEAGVDGSATLQSTAGTYQLLLPPDSVVDLDELVDAVDDAEAAVVAGDPEGAIGRAAFAAEIASRGFLRDDGEWVDRQRAMINGLAVRAALAQSAAHASMGAHHRSIEAARDALALDDTHEATYRQLMRALAAAGERAEALRVWERCRTSLVEELGVDPSPETEELYFEILGVGGPATSSGTLPSGVVTFLLTDIVESSTLWDRQPEAMASALERHDQIVGDVVAAHEGTLLKSKLEGDATVSVFSRASACASAALALLDAVSSESWPEGVSPQLRMAMHTGEAFERGGDYFGPALNRAARLRSLATADQIVLSQAVAELVRDQLPGDVVLEDLGYHDLRGLSRGENVYVIARPGRRGGEPTVEASRDRFERPPLPAPLSSTGPFVGRDDEVARVERLWTAAEEGAGGAVFVGGEPGVGKSRLAADVATRAHASGAVVLYGRCDEDLAAPLQPFIEAVGALGTAMGGDRLRAVRGIEALIRAVPQLADVVGSDEVARGADPDSERLALFDAVTQALRTCADELPVLLVLDDLHWAGKTTLSLLRHVLRGSRTSRLLVVGTYRDTELGRSHPLAATLADLRRDGFADRLSLGGLEPADVVEYLSAIGNENRALGRELAEVTSGNPFFLIEVVRHIEESGGAWEPGSLPEGVREATGRRLSRLSERTNDALSVAAVVGASFDLDLVEQVAGAELTDEIDEACRAGLVDEDAWSPGRFRFAHALVRQVLLTELVTLKRVRLHRAIAEIIEAADRDRDRDARLADLAYHWFECASAGNADRAVDACRRAADRAMERLAYEEAGDLYAMALQAMDGVDERDDDASATLHLARCDALLTAGDVAGARVAIDALEQEAVGSERLAAWYATYEGLLAVLAEPDRLVEIVRSIGAAAAAMRAVGDLVGEAKAHYVHATALERLGRIGAAERALDNALAAARAAGDRRLADAVLAEAPPAALWGPRPVTRASGSCLDVVRVLRITDGASAVEAVALRCQAVLEALRGRTESARRLVASARRTFDRLGLTHRQLEADVAAGSIELVVGDAAAAEALLRHAYEGLHERGLDGEAAQAAAFLGWALLLQERVDEADVVAAEAAELAGSDLKAGIGWRDVRAEVAARRGDVETARALAEEAVELATATDALLLVAEARLTLASVLQRSGDTTAARVEARAAAEACEAKGATAMLARIGVPARDDPTRSLHRAQGPSLSIGGRSGAGGGRFTIDCMVRDADAANRGDFSAIARNHTPSYRLDDRRRLVGVTVEGADRHADQMRFVMADGVRLGRPELVEARGERTALMSQTLSGADFEVPFLAVARVDAWGRAAESVLFDVEDLDAARAALDEVDARAVQARFENDATAAMWRRSAALDAGDLDAAVLHVSPDVVLEDRRPLVRTRMDREEMIAGDRIIVEGGGRFHCSVVATRGRSIALQRWSLHIPDPETDADVITAVRVDEQGKEMHDVVFDAGDLGEAMAELDRMYTSSEGADQAVIFAQLSSDATARDAVVVHVPRLDGEAGLAVLGRLESEAEQWIEVFRHDDVQITERERYSVDAFDRALVRCDELAGRSTGLDGAPVENLAWEAQLRFTEALHRRDVDQIVELVPAIYHYRDERTGRMLDYGRDDAIAMYRTLMAVDEFQFDVELVASKGDTLALVHGAIWLVDGAAGPSNVEMLSLVSCDAEGCIREVVAFDLDQIDDAHRALDERYAAQVAGGQDFSNLAARTCVRLRDVCNRRDVAGARACFHPDHAFRDRRPAAATNLLRDQDHEVLAGLFDLDQFTYERELLATRGDRIALFCDRVAFVDGNAGPAEVEVLSVVAVDDEGLIVRQEAFDVHRADDAYDLLDQLYVDQGGPDLRPYRHAHAARNWDRYARLFSPTFVTEDHRPLGWNRLASGVVSSDGAHIEVGSRRMGLDAFLDAQCRAVVGAADDDRLWIDHVIAHTETASLLVARTSGTHDGGTFEMPAVSLSVLDHERRIAELHIYPLEELDRARERFDRLTLPGANPAWRVLLALSEAEEQHERSALEALYAPDYVGDDRRSGVREILRGADVRADLDVIMELDELHDRFELLETRGEHLVLVRETLTFRTGQSGPAEVECLQLVEVDDTCRVVLRVAFDAGDLEAARLELDRIAHEHASDGSSRP